MLRLVAGVIVRWRSSGGESREAAGLLTAAFTVDLKTGRGSTPKVKPQNLICITASDEFISLCRNAERSIEHTLKMHNHMFLSVCTESVAVSLNTLVSFLSQHLQKMFLFHKLFHIFGSGFMRSMEKGPV